MICAVTDRLNNKDWGTVMNQIKQEVSSKVVLLSGYYIDYAGAYKDQQQSFKELLLILFASSLLVFGILLFNLGIYEFH
ncbi:hypothetical protein [Flavobacterium sp.]|uniref:hypothetical protein n=1 Tax=Flavobacterium sp. TaxID=239 RepID=UPI004047C8A1